MSGNIIHRLYPCNQTSHNYITGIKRCTKKVVALGVYILIFVTLLATVHATEVKHEPILTRRVPAHHPVAVYHRSGDVNLLRHHGLKLIHHSKSRRIFYRHRRKRQLYDDMNIYEIGEGDSGSRFPSLQDVPEEATSNNTEYPRYQGLNRLEYLNSLNFSNYNPYAIIPLPEMESSGDSIYNPPLFPEGKVPSRWTNISWPGNPDVTNETTAPEEATSSLPFWFIAFTQQTTTTPTSNIVTSPVASSTGQTQLTTKYPQVVATGKDATSTAGSTSSPELTSSENVTSSEEVSTAGNLSGSRSTDPSTPKPSAFPGETKVITTTGRHMREKWRTIVIAVLVPALVVAVVTVLALTWVFVIRARWKRHRRVDVEGQPVANGHTHDRPPGSGSSGTSSPHSPKRNGVANHSEAWTENGHSAS